MEKLRKNENFVEFEKVRYIYTVNDLRIFFYLFIFIFHFIFFLIFQWCSQDPRCRRLQLNDFLVAPMQHCTKLPLLLANIRKYTSSDYDKNILALTIGKVEISLRKLHVTCWFMSNTVMFFMDKINMTKCVFIFKHTSIWVSKNANNLNSFKTFIENNMTIFRTQ